jgi:hypothetical protein
VYDVPALRPLIVADVVPALMVWVSTTLPPT